MDNFGSVYHKSESDVLSKMQFVIDGIRKIVVLVLLMELVMQIQPGKQYEPYIKMLVGIMVVYSIISGVGSVWRNLETFPLKPMQEFVWSGDWNVNISEEKENRDKITSDVEEVHVEQIVIGEIKIEEIRSLGGTP